MLNGKQKISLVLVAVAMLFYVLRKLDVLYIPCVSCFALAVAMFLVGTDILMNERRKGKRIMAVLIIAFGLLMVLAGIMEVTNPFT